MLLAGGRLGLTGRSLRDMMLTYQVGIVDLPAAALDWWYSDAGDREAPQSAPKRAG